MIDSHHKWNSKLSPSIIGFILSILCTYAAYWIASGHLLKGAAFFALIAGLGVLQIIFQLIFFFHLGVESKPRWNLAMFLFMGLVVFLIIGGSIWIMYQLNYNTMI